VQLPRGAPWVMLIPAILLLSNFVTWFT